MNKKRIECELFVVTTSRDVVGLDSESSSERERERERKLLSEGKVIRELSSYFFVAYTYDSINLTRHFDPNKCWM